MAEELGFEPREGRPSAVFKTAALNHSTILPRCIPYKMPHKMPFVKFYLKEKGNFLCLTGLMICKNDNLVAYYIDYCFCN